MGFLMEEINRQYFALAEGGLYPLGICGDVVAAYEVANDALDHLQVDFVASYEVIEEWKSVLDVHPSENKNQWFSLMWDGSLLGVQETCKTFDEAENYAEIFGEICWLSQRSDFEDGWK